MNIRIIFERLELAEMHDCKRCIFCGYDEVCEEPDAINCELRGHWVIEEILDEDL